MKAIEIVKNPALWKSENFKGNEKAFAGAARIFALKAKLKGKKQDAMEWKEIYQSLKRLAIPKETELHINEDEEDYNLGF